MELPFSDILRLARISASIAVHDERRLRRELKTAMAAGISAPLIRETVLQTYLFAGYAAAINAFILLNQLAPGNSEFLREDEESLKKWNSRGTRLCRKIYGSQYEKLVHNMKQLHPDLAEWMIWEGYGKVLSRPFLAPRVRELLIVGMTAVLNVERQFHSHVKGALNVGANQEELRAVLREIRSFVHVRTWSRFADLVDRL